MAMTAYSTCDDFLLCRLANKYSDTSRQSPIQAKSYYSFGTPTSPAYYPAFDPVSVLASLAFLAFLLQSFASLFDRSRSIFPTVMSARESPDNIDDIEKRVVSALENYVDLEDRLTKNEDKSKISLI